jgi:hypothetical protein
LAIPFSSKRLGARYPPALAWQSRLENALAQVLDIRLQAVMHLAEERFNGERRLPLQHFASVGASGGAIFRAETKP